MATESLVKYGHTDISADTSLLVCGARTLAPRGTCIHTTSGANSKEWLQGGSAASGTPASADCLIDRSGRRFWLSPSGRYAYHAGRSLYTLDREYRNNEVSQILIGVELECLDTQAPTFEQLDSLAELLVAGATTQGWRWPFIILGHYAVARPLGRRSDPVNMDWGWLMGRLYVRALSAGVAGM
jgi:N-acetyl-anhydromuramyl-L-alanine amidase AmpD